MADRIFLPIALDANGDPVAGAEARFYLAGTTTEATVYATSAGSTVLAQPLEANAAGVFEMAAYATSGIKIDIRDPATGASLSGFPGDNWYVVPESAGSAGNVTFSPVTGNSATDVQSAIENNVTSLASKQPLDPQLTAVAALAPSLAGNRVAEVPAFTALEAATLYGILDEDDMSSDSRWDVPTQQSLVAYVGAQVAAISGEEAAIDTTSGTYASFASIPSSARQITIMLAGVSSDGTDDFLVQIGDAGGIEATGYASTVEENGNVDTSTAGFIVTRRTDAGDSLCGHVVLTKIDGTKWVASGTIRDTTGSGGGNSAGQKELSDTLTEVRLTTTGGTDTLDAGQINIFYS
ncbi:hypothetical protein ACSSNL_18105 [Thalassobius sp. S69A]|uniref:hypothetical protein n=1 Tax=unclassified Thalassovita TaxID=2619711 RepID=UPI003C7D642A